MMANLPPELIGCQAKLGRLTSQADYLDKRFNKWSEKTCEPVYEMDSATGKWVAKLSESYGDNLDFAVLIGEIAHNMRAALDYLMWQAVLKHSGKRPHDATSFPIAASTKAFVESERRVRGWPDTVRAALDSVQPYHARDVQTHPLMWLNTLSRLDKHRYILRFDPAASVKVTVGDKFKSVCVPEVNTGYLKAGDVIAMFPAAPGFHPEPDCHIFLALDIVFGGDTENLEGLKYSDVYVTLYRYLHNDIFDVDKGLVAKLWT